MAADNSKEQQHDDDDDNNDDNDGAAASYCRQQHFRDDNRMIELTKTNTTTTTTPTLSSCIPDDTDDDDDDDNVTAIRTKTTYDLIKDSNNATTTSIKRQQYNNNNKKNYYKTGLLIFSCLYTFLYMGAFFGYGPMMLMLQNDNSFGYKCLSLPPKTKANNCSEQNRSLLNVHFTAMLLQVLSPFIGHLYDIYGPLTMMIYTTIMALIGVMLLFVSRQLQVDWILYPSFAFLGMTSFSPMIVITGSIYGGGKTTKNKSDETITIEDEEQEALMMTTTTMQESSSSSSSNTTTTDTSSSITKDGNNNNDDSNDDDDDTSQRRAIALLNNLFDAGSVTYLILWKIQEITKVSFETIVLGYGGVGFIVFGGATIFWKLYLTTTNTNTTTATIVHLDDNCVGYEKKEDSTIEHNNKRRRKHQEDNDDDNDDWKKELLKSGSFLWLVFFFVFHQCRNLFMLTSAEAFLDYLGDDDNHYIAIFTGLMSASIIGFPVVDFVLGNYGYHIGLQTINLLAIVHGTIQISTTNLNIQIVGFVVFAMYRSFLFSVTFAFLLVLVQQKENVLGKANGIMFVSAGFASLCNIPLGNVTMQIFDGNFFFPNLLYTIMTIPFFYAAYQTTRTTT